jgi:hypothetical protein
VKKRESATMAAESFSCPFCDSIEQDSYFLLQHVELVHPENGESPFIVTQSNEVDGCASSSGARIAESADKGESVKHEPKEAALDQGQTLSQSISSPDKAHRYVECPYSCGELVASAELTSHTDFHLAEKMALEDEAEEYSVGAYNDAQAIKNMSTHFSTDIPKALRRDHMDRSSRTSTPRKSSLKELLFGGSPRRTPTKVSGGGTKRLGVSRIVTGVDGKC